MHRNGKFKSNILWRGKKKKLMNLEGEKRPVSIQIFGSDLEAF